MSHLINKALFPIRSTTVQFKRFRGKINIQRPRKPHYERARVTKLCTPIYIDKKKDIPVIDLCTKPIDELSKNQPIDNPLENIFAKECLNWFNHSQMVVFFHMNPITMEERFQAGLALKRENMYLKQYGRAIVKRALTGSKYEAALELFSSHNIMLFSPEMRVSKMLKIMRKYPQLILLAGIVDEQLLSRNELMNYSKLPSIEVAQSNLANVLNMAALSLSNNLMQHQSNLVSSLEQYVELQKNPEKENLTENAKQKASSDQVIDSSEDQKPV